MLTLCFRTNEIVSVLMCLSFYISVLPPSQGDVTKISEQKLSNPTAQEGTPKQRLIHVDYDLFKVI